MTQPRQSEGRSGVEARQPAGGPTAGAEARRAGPGPGQSAPAGLLLGVIAAALWTVPAAGRAATGALDWVALFGSGALLMGPLVVAMRAAGSPPSRALHAVTGLALAAAPLALFATALEVKTHHRPLGGATYAIVATAVTLGCLGVVRRLESSPHAMLWVVRAVAAVSLAVAVVWLLPALSAAPVRGSLIDVAVGLALLIVASRITLPLEGGFARAAPWAWALVVIAGLGVLTVRDGSDLVAAAPAVAGLGSWIAPGG